jgi:predicted amidophosphoribosyltransferase
MPNLWPCQHGVSRLIVEAVLEHYLARQEPYHAICGCCRLPLAEAGRDRCEICAERLSEEQEEASPLETLAWPGRN